MKHPIDRIAEKKAHGLPLELGDVVLSSKIVKRGDFEIVWWGWNQWYKWRWHSSHLDAGPISFYGLPKRGLGAWFWKIVAFCCKPMRWFYHYQYIRPRLTDLEGEDR